MKLQDFFKQCHRIIEVKNRTDYRYSDMAGKLGVSQRTYGEYMRGDISPLAAKAVLNLLSEMDDKDFVRINREWEKQSTEQKKHDNMS